MSTHETIVRDQAIEPGSDRSFGLIVGGILTVLGSYQYFTGSDIYLWLLIPGALLVTIGVMYPAALHPLNIGWMKLGLALGRIVTPVIMFLVYVVSVVPIALMLRLAGKDLLGLKKGVDKDSYWIQREPPGPSPESLRDQF